MSVLRRLNRLVRSNLNDFASRAASHSMEGEARSSIRDAKRQLVEARVAERRLSSAYESFLDEIALWDDRAFVALKANDEALARKALLKKHEVDRRASVVKEQLDAQRALMTDLRRGIDAVGVKLEAIREREGATERYERSEPSGESPKWERRRRIESALEAEAELDFDSAPVFEEFEAASDRFTDRQARREAERELRAESYIGGLADPNDRDLEQRFRELETNRDLKRLKRESTKLSSLRRLLDDEE